MMLALADESSHFPLDHVGSAATLWLMARHVAIAIAAVDVSQLTHVAVHRFCFDVYFVMAGMLAGRVPVEMVVIMEEGVKRAIRENPFDPSLKVSSGNGWNGDGIVCILGVDWAYWCYYVTFYGIECD